MKKTKKRVKAAAPKTKGLLVSVEKVRDLDSVTGGISCMPTDRTFVCNPTN